MGPVKDTAVGDIVVINVDSEGPYGVNLEADEDGCAAVIKGFEKLPNGKFGPLQKHGGVHFGDVLFAINDIQLEIVTFQEVMSIIRDRNLLKKALKFMSATEYYHRKRKKANSLNLFAQDKKDNFLSIVRRARVTQEGSSKFAQYEIACQLRVVSMKLQKEIVYKWTVWKRYTEFEQLNTALKETYGWRMGGIDFPSSHLFVLNKLASDFIDNRREEINSYWQKVIKIDKATEFNKHHCSRELKAFLDVENILRSGGGKATTSSSSSSAGGDSDFLEIPEPSGSNSSSGAGGGSVRRPSQKPTARRRSTNSTTPTLFTDAEMPASQSVASSAPGKPRPVSTPALSTNSSSSSHAVSAPAGTASAPGGGKAPPPPPPPPPRAAPAAAPPAAAPAAPAASGAAPPKAPGARANLLADIARRRIE